MTSMKNVQSSRPSLPLSIYVRNSFTPLTLNIQFQTTSPSLQMIPCMWTNEIKAKTKPSHITFKLTMRSILRFSPTNNVVVSLKDDFTVWRQKEDFLSIILMFDWSWCLVMAQTQFSLIKKTIRRPEHSQI